MHYSVEASLGNQLALEYVVPVGNWQLACQDERLAVVPVVDDLLEVVLYLPFEPDHTEVIDNKQVVGGELAEEVGLTPFQMYQPQLVDERVHREVDATSPRNHQYRWSEYLIISLLSSDLISSNSR